MPRKSPPPPLKDGSEEFDSGASQAPVADDAEPISENEENPQADQPSPKEPSEAIPQAQEQSSPTPSEQESTVEAFDRHMPIEQRHMTFLLQDRAAYEARVKVLCQTHPEVRELVEANAKMLDEINGLRQLLAK